MPSLMPLTWTTTSPKVPQVWRCSECRATFDMGPISNVAPSLGQVEQVNRQFEIHCKQVHPGLALVIGLKRPSQRYTEGTDALTKRGP
jgi:hypothetical protein